jgi:hypothetical protein
MIFHYTSINTLALILESRKIRFNRLDRVDDLLESQTACGIGFGKYFFVSCWTKSEQENIPLWNMYTPEMKGIRIGLPDTPFHMSPLRAPRDWNAVHSGSVLSPLTFDEMFSDTYCILPIFLTPAMFAGDVQYVEDVPKVYKENIQLTITGNTAQLELKNLPLLPRTKNSVWAFQREHRFALLITPSIPVPPGGLGDPTFLERFPNHLISSFLQNVDHGVNYFDLRLNDEALDRIQVTLGPFAEPADSLRVKSLISEYTASGVVSHSSLAGTIRQPIRS